MRSEQGIRRRIVDWALWGLQERRTDRLQPERLHPAQRPRQPGTAAAATDCSAFATLCYCWAGAPNPNASGAYDARRPAYTGSMLRHLRRIPRDAVKPGDLVVWSPPSTGQHVCIVVSNGPDPMLVSHGDSSGPNRLRFSAEDSHQRRHGHGRTTWLSAF